MRKILVVLYLSLSFIICAQAQRDISIEFQLYPTGVIPTLSYDHGLGASSAFTVRLGANIFDHRDLGVHQGEEGSGFGGSIGYKKYLGSTRDGLFWRVRNDLWFNNVDWFDIGPADQRIEGKTAITVLQPTASIGYTILTSTEIVISPSLSFGYEWNVKTSGEPTGEGTIVLLGVQIGKRF